MSILSVAEGQCKECYSCIRACPVKAIKMANGQIEILDERCIYCGRCVLACSKGSVELDGDFKRTFELLSSDKKVVAVLAPEYAASFYPMTTEQLTYLIERAGFYGHEDTVLAEEMVARHYLRYFASKDEYPVIRSTCPAATIWIEKYYPELNEHLAPVITPAEAQARLVKSIYGADVAVVYVTPCIAAKKEALTSSAIDAVLTFSEFKNLLTLRLVGFEDDHVVKKNPRPEIRRRYSVPGGFPRPTIAQYNMLDPTLMVLRGVDDLDDLEEAVLSGKLQAKFIDLLVCDGCIDGPGIDTSLSIHLRKSIIDDVYNNRLVHASKQITFDQIEPYLPKIDMQKTFTNRKVKLAMPSEEAILEILAEGEKFSRDDELDCGACGYKTCREQAIAIYQGIADWDMCFPFRRQVYNRIINELKETAVTDGLTGLYNHKSFLERLSVEFNRAERYGPALSLMMIDIDKFKEINDTFGHVTGDSVLKAIASTLKNNTRQSDFAARYGGDEFALILPETNLDKAYKVGEKLRHTVESNPIVLNPDIVIRVTLSIGIASYDPSMSEPLALIQKTDEALYKAKQGGRNQTAVSSI
ncbi:MAG: diguanylate cyclase [Firmicutes bacterium]|nr:diguanylate cyclase [Bacillota bacterium]